MSSLHLSLELRIRVININENEHNHQVVVQNTFSTWLNLHLEVCVFCTVLRSRYHVTFLGSNYTSNILEIISYVTRKLAVQNYISARVLDFVFCTCTRAFYRDRWKCEGCVEFKKIFPTNIWLSWLESERRSSATSLLLVLFPSLFYINTTIIWHIRCSLLYAFCFVFLLLRACFCVSRYTIQFSF